MALGTVSRGGAIAAGLCGAVFLAYCFYFDHKRRSAPDFKSKLRLRRKRVRQSQELSNVPKLPDMKDPEAVQKFFLEEVQLGEELLTQGELEQAVQHLTNAVAVCNKPLQLMQVLQQTLSPPVFQMLLQNLPMTGSQPTLRMTSSQNLAAEDDVE
ncbi:mitochondrial import receptor subunit TOM20 homolog isoform X1 [Lampetra fluviatilis]